MAYVAARTIKVGASTRHRGDAVAEAAGWSAFVQGRAIRGGYVCIADSSPLPDAFVDTKRTNKRSAQGL